MSKYVIGFNGPPGSGKDTAGEVAAVYLRKMGYHVVMMKYAQAVKVPVNYLLGVVDPHLPHEDLKEKKTWLHPDVTYRKAYIEFSETYVKPLFGQDAFGRIIASTIEAWDTDIDGTTVFIITDCGFGPEQEPVIDVVGSRNYALVQMYRQGHTFEGDSRSYVTLERGYKSRIFNTTVDTLAASVQRTIDVFIMSGEWHP